MQGEHQVAKHMDIIKEELESRNVTGELFRCSNLTPNDRFIVELGKALLILQHLVILLITLFILFIYSWKETVKGVEVSKDMIDVMKAKKN